MARSAGASDHLESLGLVQRQPHPSDRRTTLVELTEHGRQRLTSATTAVTTANFGLFGLEEQESAQLSELLTKVRRSAGDFA